MRIFAVAHGLHLFHRDVQGGGKVIGVAFVVAFATAGDLAPLSCHPGVDGGVVTRGVAEYLVCKAAAGGAVDLAAFQLIGDIAVVGRVDQYRDRSVVFGRRAQQRRAADIYILDALFKRAVGSGHGLLERVQIDHDDVDGVDAVIGHDLVIGAAPTEEATVDAWVQGLEAPSHHFRKAGVVRYLGHRDVVFGQHAGGAAGRQQVEAELVQATGEGG